MFKALTCMLSLLVLSGCASIVGEKMQTVMVQTTTDNVEVAGVGCTLTNDEGSWFLTTPASVLVHKSTADLAVDCKKDNIFGHQTVVSKSNGLVWGNLLFGGIVGYIVDRNTGAGFDYPATTSMMLRPVGGMPVSAIMPGSAAVVGAEPTLMK